MKKRSVIRKVVFCLIAAIIMVATIATCMGMLTMKQKIALAILDIAVILYILLRKVFIFVRNQWEVSTLEVEYMEIERLHKEKYFALLNGDKEKSQELSKDFDSQCQNFKEKCRRKLQECPTMDRDQYRKILTLLNMTEHLRKSPF